MEVSKAQNWAVEPQGKKSQHLPEGTGKIPENFSLCSLCYDEDRVHEEALSS
jgi:hypothetical protein